MSDNTPSHYSATSRLYHWGMAVLIIGAIVAVELHEFFPKGDPVRGALVNAHKQAGLLVFLLVWLRLSWNLRHPAPAIVPEPAPIVAFMAKAGHGALYLCMIALPALGFVMSQMGERPLSLFGLPLPTLFGPDKAMAGVLKEGHEVVGNFMIFLIAAHAAAAIWHHVKLKDNTLLRMLRPRG